jgi:hypothetical protein
MNAVDERFVSDRFARGRLDHDHWSLDSESAWPWGTNPAATRADRSNFTVERPHAVGHLDVHGVDTA